MLSRRPPRFISFYNNVNFKTQLFSFSFSTMNYLIENSDSKVLKKIQKTCKYFYFKRQIFVTPELILSVVKWPRGLAIKPQLKPQELPYVRSQFWLTDRFCLYDHEKFSEFLPKIFKCELSFLFILEYVHLIFSDLKLLTNSGTIEEFLIDCKVYESENKIVPIHQILALVPKAYNFRLSFVNVDQKAMKIFLKEERNVKFQKFHLRRINQMLDSNLVFEFIKNNLTTTGEIALNFATAEMNEEFRNAVDPQIRSILPQESLEFFFGYLAAQWQ